MKLQTSNSKLQGNFKLQTSKAQSDMWKLRRVVHKPAEAEPWERKSEYTAEPRRAQRRIGVEPGIWSFFGVWSLEFGVCPA